jgi:hypothetical protein
MPADPYLSLNKVPPPPLPLPHAPRLHWGFVLALNIVTRSLFAIIWLIVQANWVRKVRGKSMAFRLAIAHLCCFPALFVMMAIAQFFGIREDSTLLGVIFICGLLSFFGLWIATVFTLRDELSEDPINLQLGGVMTLLFGPVYFQYYLHDFEANSNNQRIDGVLGLSQLHR